MAKRSTRPEPDQTADGGRRPVLLVRRPRCPTCGSTDLTIYASRRRRDGGRLRYARCGGCGCKLLMIVQ